MKPKLLLSIIAMLFATAFFIGCEEGILHPANISPEIQCSEEGQAHSIIYENHRFFTNSTFSIEEKNSIRLLSRSFTVNVPETGEYYINAHVLPTGGTLNGVAIVNDIDVYVNEIYTGKLNVTKLEWEFATMQNNLTVPLHSGTSTITFKSAPSFYPEIDAIEIEKEKSALMVSDARFSEYLGYLKSNNDSKADEISVTTKGKTIGDELIILPWQVMPYQLENPDGDYYHLKNVPVTYTYHRLLNLNVGQYTFVAKSSTENLTPINIELCLYNLEKPNGNSFYSFDETTNSTTLNAKITEAGAYYLIAHAPSNQYSTTPNGRMGVADIYQNGVLINTSMPIAGYSINMPTNKTGLLNFFTANSTGRTSFFLKDNDTKQIYFGATVGYYVDGMDFLWINEPRLLINKPNASYSFSMLVTAENALLVNSGKCDVYGNCTQVGINDNIMKAFPNLKNADAIYSGISDNPIYNCASWAGGLTNTWTWGSRYNLDNGKLPLDPGINPYIWETWDNYFGNIPPRYNGAITYTRENANENNAAIAVWSTSSSINNVTHFSVKGDANNHPHGYDWESKPGSLRRIFHPKDALRGTGYGSIIAYYTAKTKYVIVPNSMNLQKSADIDRISSIEESVKAGLTTIEDVRLSVANTEALSHKVVSLNNYTATNSKLNQLYKAWEESLNSPQMLMVSNPFELISNDEGLALIEFGKQNKICSLAFFANLYFEKNNESIAKELSYLIFCQIFSEYAQILETIKENWANNQYSAEGAYIAPLPDTFIKKFVKQLISQLNEM